MTQHMTRPTTVVFDVGRVLYRWHLSALLEKVIDDPARLAFALDNVVTEEWHFRADKGEALADMVPQRIAEYPDYADALNAYALRFNETIPGPVEGTHALVERLDDAGVPLYALTNFGHEFWAGFHPTAPIFDRFRDIVVSGTEKVAKPDPAIYRIVEARSGCAPHELFFIDDNAANIAAAEALGWHAHLFTDAATLAEDLVDWGLLAS